MAPSRIGQSESVLPSEIAGDLDLSEGGRATK